MRGFYSGNKPKQKQTLSEKIIADPCSVCGLYKGCHSPHTKPHGQGKLGIYIRAEANGKDEDEYYDSKTGIKGKQLIGEAGQLLRKHLKVYGIDIDRDCVKDNSCRCRPPKNRKPTNTEVKCCKNFTDKTVEEIKPKFIWLLGSTAIKSFYGDRFSDTSITRWRGLCIPDKDTGAWVLPMFHPSYLVRNSTDDHLRSTFERDIKFAVSCLKKKPPTFIDWESRAKVLYDEQEVIKLLQHIDKTADLVFFDYETNALKPFYPGAQLFSLSVATSIEEAWSFKLTPKILLYWRRVLLNPKIRKVAHNLKFEDVWSREKLKIKDIANWHWCTMNCAHVLDTRKKFTGLKFQAYINFGVGEYDKEIGPYLKAKGGHLNRIKEAPLEKVLKYSSLDSLLGMALYEKQFNLLNGKNEKRLEAFELFRDGLVALADAELEGICTDEMYYKEQDWTLDEKIKKLETELVNSKEAKLFKKKTGKELVLKKEFSAADLRKLFFTVLGYKATKKTAKAGEDSVDAEVLHSLNSPFANKIIERRKLAKTKGTYLAQFARESYDGKIHPFFDLHTTTSTRSSSSRPNFQNIPARDEEAKAIVRKGIIPSQGNKLLCIDYGANEIRGACFYSHDKALMKYIESGADPHYDETKSVLCMTDNQVEKPIRDWIKNQFVFPEIYGSYYGSIAPNIMENCWDLLTKEKIPLKEHLKRKGIIRNYKDINGFVRQVKRAEKKFWDKYWQLREWQDKTVRDYLKKGYIEMFMGFRRGGLLTRNQICNTPIQGTSFHLLLWSYIQLNKWQKKYKLRSKLVGEIHDEMIWDLDPSEEKDVIEQSVYVMKGAIRERFEWINVPMLPEVSITGIDESWYHKKGIK